MSGKNDRKANRRPRDGKLGKRGGASGDHPTNDREFAVPTACGLDSPAKSEFHRRACLFRAPRSPHSAS